MGGYGSGRSGWHRKVEDMLCLNVDQVRREKCLEPGRVVLWQWTWTSGDKASIRLEPRADSLGLAFTVKDGDTRREVAQDIELERTVCNYGGTRTWFLCPRCGRRVAKLYGGSSFYCRHCHGLRYRSQAESGSDRLLRKARKIRARLGAGPSFYDSIDKPKWMRWPTFERLMAESTSYENAGLIALYSRLPSVRARLHRLPVKSRR